MPLIDPTKPVVIAVDSEDDRLTPVLTVLDALRAAHDLAIETQRDEIIKEVNASILVVSKMVDELT